MSEPRASADERAALRRDGYVVLRGQIDRAALDALRSGFRYVFRRQFAYAGIAEAGTFDASLAALFKADMPRYLAAAKLTQYLPALHALGAAPGILALLRDLGLGSPVISTRPVVHIVSEALKVPGGYHRTPPHQDWRSVQGSLDALVLWLPLSETGPEQAPLEVVPGSHRRGLLATEPDPFGTRVATGLVAEEDFVPLTAGPGDIVAFSMFTVHRTGLRQGPGVRWAVSFRYNNLDEPGFVARGYPNPYIYKPRETLLSPQAPDAAAVSRVFDAD
ncbi:MAG: phytanoyl-CoA dioxygenase family protein [Alphaproteobacteria bacterium]